ncbi:AsmA family protein [Mangrovimonas aestuarii]|uniref:hypothetical protein n=1 Tax=Mangrovimonas aestuarii TaxID=3018443 RepID=UPI0023789754|nr:hypothetical protein [Mangrovimonas aestuarii]
MAYLYKMIKQRKRVVWVSISMLTLAVISFFVLKSILVHKIENYLANSLPETVKVDYQDIVLNLLKGDLQIDHLSVLNKGEVTNDFIVTVEVQKLLINNVSYLNYFLSDKISVGGIELVSPSIVYYHYKAIPSKKYNTLNIEKIKKGLEFKQLCVKNGNFKMVDKETDSTMVSVTKFDFEIDDVETAQSTLKEKVPFLYDDYQLSLNDLTCAVGEYETLNVSHSVLSKENSVFTKIKLYTKYSKERFSRIIKTERDHFDLICDSVRLSGFYFRFITDSTLCINSSLMSVMTPKLNVYRDKLVANDLTVKKLYSEMLRDLPFSLNVNQVNIVDGQISYTEKVKWENKGGTLDFSKFNASIENLSNTYKSPIKTKIKVKSNFMGNTPIDVDWNFDVNNTDDAFTFNARLGKLKAEQLNKFLEPNLRSKLEGEINHTRLAIQGNAKRSNIDLQIKYDDLNVVVLRKDGTEKNKLLSKIVNLVVDKDSGKRSNQKKETKIKSIERDKTKSVFNFIWKNTKGALLKVLTSKSP